MLTFNNVSKTFDDGQTFVVKDVSLTINDGELLVLLGSSGCGKTTSLKMINRLIETSSGCIEIDHVDIKHRNIYELRQSIGYVFQDVGLFPHLSIADNITIQLQLAGKDKKQQLTRARELLELVNLDPQKYLYRFPSELSGGEQQRVGVARALASNPDYLLMDEPFAALDAITRNELQDEILSLKQRLNKTIVFVTHDILEAIKLSDKIAVMNHGRLEAAGDYQTLMNTTDNAFVTELFSTQLKQYQQISTKAPA